MKTTLFGTILAALTALSFALGGSATVDVEPANDEPVATEVAKDGRIVVPPPQRQLVSSELELV